MWAPHPSLPPDTRGHGYRARAEIPPPVPGRVLSCFIECATLCECDVRIHDALVLIREV